MAGKCEPLFLSPANSVNVLQDGSVFRFGGFFNVNTSITSIGDLSGRLLTISVQRSTLFIYDPLALHHIILKVRPS